MASNRVHSIAFINRKENKAGEQLRAKVLLRAWGKRSAKVYPKGFAGWPINVLDCIKLAVSVM